MVGVKELDRILVVKGGSGLIKRYTMFFDIGIFLAFIPFKNKFLHMYIVRMIII